MAYDRTDAFRAVALPDGPTVVHRMPAKIHRRCHCHLPPPEISLPFPHPLLDHFENSFHRDEYRYHFANYSSCLSVVDGVADPRPNDDRLQYSLSAQSVAVPSSSTSPA